MGTLVYDPFYVEVPRFFGMTLDELLAAKDPTAWIEFELAAIDEPTFLARFFADRRDYDQAGFVEQMRASYRWLDGMEPLLAELAESGATMHAFSNYTCWYAAIEERLRLSRYLAWSFVSCDTRLRKPDPEAYLHALRELDLDSTDCLFVDDKRRNCDAARALGIPAIHFRDAPSLRAELGARGLLRQP